MPARTGWKPALPRAHRFALPRLFEPRRCEAQWTREQTDCPMRGFARERIPMKRTDFETNLREAIRSTLEATREFVADALPDKVRLLIVPNCSCDDSLEDDEEVYSGEELPPFTTLAPKTEAEAVDFLYRKGKVPEWINVAADSADGEYTDLVLECCGRFTGMAKHVYHREGGIPPFNPQVAMPRPPYNVGTDGKFSLRRRYNNARDNEPHSK